MIGRGDEMAVECKGWCCIDKTVRLYSPVEDKEYLLIVNGHLRWDKSARVGLAVSKRTRFGKYSPYQYRRIRQGGTRCINTSVQGNDSERQTDYNANFRSPPDVRTR